MNTSQTFDSTPPAGNVPLVSNPPLTTPANSDRLASDPLAGNPSVDDATNFRINAFESSGTGQILLGSYPSYVDAQRVVDHLSDEKFPVQNTSIIGRDLVFVEQVTGRRTWIQVLLGGLGSGAAMGLFIGLLLGLFVVAPDAWIAILVWSTGFGAFFGLVFSALGYAASGGSRDFNSMGRVTASRYDVLVQRELADEAQQLLSKVLAQ